MTACLHWKGSNTDFKLSIWLHLSPFYRLKLELTEWPPDCSNHISMNPLTDTWQHVLLDTRTLTDTHTTMEANPQVFVFYRTWPNAWGSMWRYPEKLGGICWNLFSLLAQTRKITHFNGRNVHKHVTWWLLLKSLGLFNTECFYLSKGWPQSSSMWATTMLLSTGSPASSHSPKACLWGQLNSRLS